MQFYPPGNINTRFKYFVVHTVTLFTLSKTNVLLYRGDRLWTNSRLPLWIQYSVYATHFNVLVSNWPSCRSTLTRISLKVWTNNGHTASIYMKLNWKDLVFLSTREQRRYKPTSYEYWKMSARKGAQFAPIGMPTIFPQNPRKNLLTRICSILMMSFSI